MKVFEANISVEVSDYLKRLFQENHSFEQINLTIFESFGLIDFVNSYEELYELKTILLAGSQCFAEPDRAEYGDFQTNQLLANKAVKFLTTKNILPEIIVEPTCGKGNFIIAALQCFSTVRYIFGVEIYKPYIWETKFNVIDFYLNCSNKEKIKPNISIIH